MTDSVCTADTCGSQALKYFVLLRPEKYKRVAQSIPISIEQAMFKAKLVEHELSRITNKKEPTLTEVKLAQVSNESISNKNYDAIKQH